VLVIVLVLALSSMVALRAEAATQSQVSDANAAIQSAFVSTHSAESSGGNVSSLVAKLNLAIQLVQKATAENATNPAQASTDLSNASSIAQSVGASAGAVGRQGASAKQAQQVLSLGSAGAIVVVAALIYAFGDRIYRRAWLRLYGGYVVKRVG
jgi:hypothetical protein